MCEVLEPYAPNRVKSFTFFIVIHLIVSRLGHLVKLINGQVGSSA